MIEAPLYPNEEQRLNSLRALGLLDTPLDVRFERITRMVKIVMGVPIAIFNLIDSDRQYYKSVQGLDAIEAPKPPAFCTHAILEERMLYVPDARLDNRFASNPFVTGERLDIVFYAGCPIRCPDGYPIGTLCAIDTKTHEMTMEKLQTLRDLADMIETELRITDLSNSQSQLILELDSAKRLAMIDPLTRLWNRGGIETLLSKEMTEASRYGRPLTLAMCDIDYFKKINDNYGHPVGDAVLKAVAKTLIDSLRTEDIVGRVGGEEFLIVLTDAQPESVFNTLERLRETIEQLKIEHEGNVYSVTMSFGVLTDIPESQDDMAKFVKHADEALYKAKEAGRNRVKVATISSDLVAYSKSL